ncbi:hypothetical protein BMI90_13525 [Thioclava sp. L04-15]|uniref:hypothetical protein n=1 Tax=Thioclava sp. L04-15 TaxID=1915318 RepID=UPI000995F2C8|nr:hypothetical protein [Thioclava sp. L04-15]OOY27119.1 hypothetical protein BMI90_13525 [Thioclava sp. L04-15]TNE82734.1 MAG: hypothetical protein EP337_18510 [Paracoccaceae bacterium]
MLMRLANPFVLPAAGSLPALSRRVLALSAMAGLSGCLFYSHVALAIGAMPLWLFAACLYALGVGLSAAFILAFLPGLSRFIAFTAVSRLGLALVAVQSPSVASVLISTPALNATLVVGLALALQQLARVQPQFARGVHRLALS